MKKYHALASIYRFGVVTIFFTAFAAGAQPARSADFYRIRGSKINIRTDSTVQSQSLGYADQGDIVQVLEQNYQWMKVRLPRRFSCYVASDYVKRIGKNRGEVTADTLNLRAAPRRASPRVGQIHQNDQVYILTSTDGWYEIKGYPYMWGWIHEQFLEKIETSAEETAAEKSPQPPKPSHPAQTSPEETAALDEIISRLKEPDMNKKKEIHRTLIDRGPSLAQELHPKLKGIDRHAAYSIIHVLSEIGKEHPILCLHFLSKTDPEQPRVAGIYLDIAQNILKTKKAKTPFYFLATKNKLSAAEILDAKTLFRRIYIERFELSKD
ncbi:MAG: SH3 domain-containing protein [Candidatus Omnitrophica bacterium]|nr:SH3 domain-containing protein [Candidatus Omnitrophota bacterium]